MSNSAQWQDDWIDGSELYGEGVWSHHDLAVTADQRIVGFRSGANTFWIIDQDGKKLSEWKTDLNEGHGLTISQNGDTEELWVADPGVTFPRRDDGTYFPPTLSEDHGRVVVFDLEGNVISELPTPDLPLYEDEIYRPTTIFVDDEGDGSIWVADGYGANVVHHLSREGEVLLTLTGEEGAGRFDKPHSVMVDRRREGDPRVYVTDRTNNRIAVYDLDGNFQYAIAEGLREPSGFALIGDDLVVAELQARVTILDLDDKPIARFGDDADAMARGGWPNAEDEDGLPVRPELQSGLFNSPHGLAVNDAGDIFVSEWVLGGRLVRLRPDGAAA